MLDVDQFEERAAICQYEGRMSGFDAETAAANEQGFARWQAMKFVKEAANAERDRHPAGGGDTGSALAREFGTIDLPGVQSQPEEENRSMSERLAQARWAGVVLLALFIQGGAVL